MYFPGAYSVPAVAELILKIACIMHVVKNGRNTSWIWLIIFFPFGGSVIYFLTEMWPDIRANRSGGFRFSLPQSPEKQIALLQEELEYSNTIENRMKLARAFVAARRFDEAVDTLNSSLRGTFKDDPLLLIAMARTQFDAERYEAVLEPLHRLNEVRSKHALAERIILQARTYEALGQIDQAKRCYDEALATTTGEEARVRYGLLLEKLGEIEGALNLFRETVAHAKRGGGAYRRYNREWIRLARTHLEK